jgi:hypothetical protein
MGAARRYSPKENFLLLSIILLAFATNQFILKSSFPDNIFIHSWGNDALVMPAIFSSGAIARAATKANIAFTHFYYLGVTFFCSFTFEYIRPIFIKNSVTDTSDILAYCIGAAAYIYWAKRNEI